jgi:hypothetical protein
MERTAGIEAKDVIRTVRISPIDAQRAFSQAPLDRKLCGNQLGHFGGFLKGSWRANDIMWGRVDAVCQLIECLVTPERIADLAQSGKASRRTAELDLAQILPGASADERLELQRDIEKLEDYAREHLTAQDVRNSRFNGFLTRLVKAAQGAIFDEEIPTVLQTAIDEQVRWNSYRMPKSGTVPFDTERQVWKTGVKKVDLAVLSFAQQELTRNIHNATPGYWRRYFEEKKYKVGEELVGEAIPTPILLEMATHSALVLQNCVTAAAGETRSQRIRDSLVYRFGLSYPVRAAYSFARFQRTAPEFAKSSITFVATLAMTLLVVGALGWDRLIHPESGFAFSTFGLLIVAPAVALFGLMILFTGVKVVWLIASAVFALLTLLLLIHLDVVTPNSSWIARWSALREFVGVLSDYRGAIAVGTLVSVVLAIPFRRMWTDIRLLIRRWAAPKPRASVAPIAGSAEPTAATNQKAAGKSR